MIPTGFTGFDEVSGGLHEKKNYIVYGNIGTGKSSFCLKFLHQGLVDGETVGLVTRRSASLVFEHTRSFGLDLEPFARKRRLILFEYIPNVVENCLRLKDNEQINTEFRAFLGNDIIQRLVFDPVTPLLSSPSSSASIFRARSLIQSLSELGATCLYVFDTPEGEDCLANCKDFVYGVLRFEASPFESSHGRMALERFPELQGGRRYLDFKVTPGAGLVEVAAPHEPGRKNEPSPRRKILIIEPDAEQRTIFKDLLDKNYAVLEADSGADGLAKIAADSPDLILLEKESKGLDGIEICRKLRQNRLHVPIVLIAHQIRRARDRVATTAAGADECLERPADGRMLKLKIEQLLGRYDASRDRLAGGILETSVTTALDRDKTTSTTNLAYFYDRVRQEQAYSIENALSFALVTLRLPNGATSCQELLELASALIREYDLVYIGKQGVAVLLGETDDKGVTIFLDRFKQRWNRTSAPGVAHLCFDRREDFLETAKRLMNVVEAPQSPTGGTAPAHV